mgnify:FL=1
MTKDNPKKLSNEERRKQLYFQKWGLSEKNSTGDLRQDMRVWTDQADPAEKKSNNYYPGAISIEDSISKMPKVDVASITKRRLEYEHNNNFEEPEKGIGELLNTRESNND